MIIRSFYVLKRFIMGQTFASVIPAGLPQNLENRGYEVDYLYLGLDVGNVLLQEETETLYDDSGKVTTSKTYTYDDYGQLKGLITDTSMGVQMSSITTRASDYGSQPPCLCCQSDFEQYALLSY